MKHKVYYLFLFCIGYCFFTGCADEQRPTNSNGRAKMLVRELGESAKIIGGSIGAACLYGVLNDQVTARVCPEYFSKGFHERALEYWKGPLMGNLRKVLLATKSPTVVATIWGVVASWWMGALLGVPAAFAARVGPWPKVGATDLIKPIGIGLAGMGSYVAYKGHVGYKKALAGTIDKDVWRNDIAQGTPEEALNRFIACAYAHQAAYQAGPIVGIGLFAYIVGKRILLHRRAL